MSAIKIFVTQKGTAVVECPQCKNGKTITVTALKGKKFTRKVKCPCGHIFAINLDFREHYRKQTHLEGNYRKSNLNIESYYAKLPNKTGTHRKHSMAENNCTVKDLSIGGVGLDIWGRHTIEEGDTLFIAFKLDIKKDSFIRAEATVKTVQNNYVGAEFKNKLDNNPDLGFYLMP